MPCSNPAWWVPPFGVAMMFDVAVEHGLVADPPAQRDVDGAFAGEFGGRHVPVRLQHRNGLGVGARPGEPPRVGERHIRCEVVDVLRDAAVEAERLVGSAGPARLSVTLSVSPGIRNAVWRTRSSSSSVWKVAPLVKISRVGPVPHPGAGDAAAHLADDAQFALAQKRRERRIGARLARVGEDAGLAAVERHRPGLAVAVHLDVEALRQRVDDGGADAVQPAGCRVGAVAELAAGVQLGEDHFHAGQPGLRLDVDGHAARGVAHLDAVVRVQDHVDLGAEAAERLVDAVVDDLPEAVHEAAGVGRADVHARTLPDRLKPFEHREVAGGVVGIGHSVTSLRSAPSLTSGVPGSGNRHPRALFRRATFLRVQRNQPPKAAKSREACLYW